MISDLERLTSRSIICTTYLLGTSRYLIEPKLGSSFKRIWASRNKLSGIGDVHSSWASSGGEIRKLFGFWLKARICSFSEDRASQSLNPHISGCHGGSSDWDDERKRIASSFLFWDVTAKSAWAFSNSRMSGTS